MSRWIAHFFRSVDFRAPTRIIWPAIAGHGSATDADVLPPLYMLRHAIRLGRIYPSWAIGDDGVKTVLGDRPVVSFTELTLERLRTIIERRRLNKESGSRDNHFGPVGIFFSQKSAEKSGVKRAIYGPKVPRSLQADDRDVRMLRDSSTGSYEHYRFIQTRGDGSVHWTNEHEWRWPYSGGSALSAGHLEAGTSDHIGGFHLDDYHLHGVGIIVSNRGQISKIRRDILTKIDRRDVSPGHYCSILPITELMPQLFQRHAVEFLDEAVEACAVGFRTSMFPDQTTARTRSAYFNELVDEVTKDHPLPVHGEFGNCWLWLLDNTHSLTRLLLATGRVRVNRSGRYLVDIPRWRSYNLRQRETMTEDLASRLMDKIRLPAGYFSVLGKIDADALPFFSNILEHSLFHNLPSS